MGATVRFGLQAGPVDRVEWLETARQAEDLGYTFLCIGDHPGSHPSPIVSLAAAAAVTSSINLGPYVSNVGVRHPLDLAVEIATLDLVSNGRAVLGLGAGHTPLEWEQRGARRPGVQRRVHHLIDTATAIQRLLAGETVSMDSPGVKLVDATLSERVCRRVPLLIGGNNRQILQFASEHADIIGLTGMGRTLADGHKHELKWGHPQLTESFEIARSRPSRSPKPEIQALVQLAQVTDDAAAVAATMAADFDVPVEQILESPFVLIGTVGQIVERIHRNTQQWGIDSYVVRRPALTDFAEVINQL